MAALAWTFADGADGFLIFATRYDASIPTSGSGTSLVAADPTERFRILRPLRHHQFTEEMRAAFSQDATRFFIKSHHPPWKEYLDGEYVVQIVRHPGPTIWSYYRYLHRHGLRNKLTLGVTLDDVIDGNVLLADGPSITRTF